MSSKSARWLVPGTIVGILLGGVLGMQIPALMRAIGFVGEIFVNLLVFALLPLILTSVVLGVYQMGSRPKVTRVVGRALAFFAGFAVLASLVGLIIGLLLRPGAGVETIFSDLHQNWSPLSAVNIPSGIYIGLVLFSILFGVALTSFGTKARSVLNFLSQASQVMTKTLGGFLYLAPIGLFSITGALIAGDLQTSQSVHGFLSGNPVGGLDIMRTGGTYLISAVVGLLFLGVVVVPVVLRLFGKQSVIGLLQSVSPAILTSFSVSSSLAAMPLTYHGITEKQGIDRRGGALTLPLGLIFNVGATTLCTVIATLFLAQVAGVNLSWFQYILVLVLPILLSVGRVGLPYPLLTIMIAQLAIIGMPGGAMAGLGAILLTDWLVDRVRSALNVWSDAACTALVVEAFEFRTARKAPAPSRERSGARAVPTSSRGRSTYQKPAPRRTGTSDERRGREQRASESRGGDRRPGGRDRDRPSPRNATTQTHDPSGDRASRQPAESSPFDISDSQTPMLDIDVSGPGQKAPTPVSTTEAKVSQPPTRNQPPRAGGRSQDTATRRERPRSSPRVQTRKRVETEVKSEPEPAGERGRLSPDTIARELKKVSDQLVSYDSSSPQSEPKKQPDPQISIALPTDSDHVAPDKGPPATDHQRAVESPGKKDAPTDPTDNSEAQQETAPEVAVPQETEVPEEAAPRFGRSVVRREGKLRKNTSPPPVSPEPEPESDSGFSNKGVTSFGRTKRRKT